MSKGKKKKEKEEKGKGKGRGTGKEQKGKEQQGKSKAKDEQKGKGPAPKPAAKPAPAKPTQAAAKPGKPAPAKASQAAPAKASQAAPAKGAKAAPGKAAPGKAAKPAPAAPAAPSKGQAAAAAPAKGKAGVATPAAATKPGNAAKAARTAPAGKEAAPAAKGGKAGKAAAPQNGTAPAKKKLFKGRGGQKLPTDPALLAKELGRRARIAAAKAAKKAKPPEPEEDEDEEEDEAEDAEGVLAEDDLEEDEGEDEEELPEGGGDLDQREVLLHDALRSQRQRDYAAAERYINRFIELYPDDLRGPVHLGNMKRARGDREGALEAYKGALKRDRDNPLALWSKADFHLSDPVNPDIGEAQDALKRIVHVWGRKRDDASQKWAEQARDKLRYCESRKYSVESRRWLQPGKDGAAPARKSLEKAKDLLSKALNVYPADPRNHMNLGSVYLQLGQPEHTIERCREAIRIHPGYARAHLILGYAHRRLGQLRQAKDAFLQCIELDRQQRDVAEAWRARREVEQELARFRRRFYNALSGKPGDDGEAEQLDLHRLKEWVALLEGDLVETADLTLDARGGGYVLTAHGQRSTYKAWPGPEGLVLERQ